MLSRDHSGFATWRFALELRPCLLAVGLILGSFGGWFWLGVVQDRKEKICFTWKTRKRSLFRFFKMLLEPVYLHHPVSSKDARSKHQHVVGS